MATESTAFARGTTRVGWPGGRYELHRPSNATLDRLEVDWPDSLSLDPDPAERHLRKTETKLAQLREALPDSIAGVEGHGFACEHPVGRRSATIAFRACPSAWATGCGAGHSVRRLPGTVRYGFSDERVTGHLTLVRDAPEGRFALSGYRDIMA